MLRINESNKCEGGAKRGDEYAENQGDEYAEYECCKRQGGTCQGREGTDGEEQKGGGRRQNEWEVTHQTNFCSRLAVDGHGGEKYDNNDGKGNSGKDHGDDNEWRDEVGTEKRKWREGRRREFNNIWICF